MLGLLLCFIGIAWGWQENVRPKMYVQYGLDDMLRFQGNASFVDHFRLLETDRNWLLVGARNKLYNLTATTLQENQGLDWFTAHEHVQMCLLKGRNEDECQNYVRLLAIKSPGKIVLCGTHAFKPMCRDYSFKDGQYVLDKQYSGQGLSPYDPSHNTTAVMVDGDLYVGTVADFSGTDPLIYREPLRTEQYDAMHMSAPNFVSSFGHGEHVYFLFRETAIEYMNCGKSIYSRIARVCKQDRGGPHRFKFRWTTFLKGRLNCSIPGDFPFYFNEIREYIVFGNQNKRVFALNAPYFYNLSYKKLGIPRKGGLRTTKTKRSNRKKIYFDNYEHGISRNDQKWEYSWHSVKRLLIRFSITPSGLTNRYFFYRKKLNVYVGGSIKYFAN